MEQITINPHLLKGANEIMQKIGSPANLLQFLQDALVRVHMYEMKNNTKKEYVFSLSLLIEYIVQPWFQFGSDAKEHIARGIGEINDSYGHEFYHDTMGILVAAIGEDFGDGLEMEDSFENKWNILYTLIALVYPIQAYEEERTKKRNGQN